ncbi:MAG: DUF1249 domain-containing protein [Gammaproteobacteria bacterium]|nr:DUF1249 domain-containing protein [Gammaproteobacteria bacterium]MDH5240024.1 DUF1249 domain-containing protein [Gammaproteobacteria bacterium]MDH5262342.1 DUF1249 domain-containing protein [Gammaproteobacteria bacterium]MDH5583538.1 DUF1249 domain-containing protein [Gammaproteobacteria bacterium]
MLLDSYLVPETVVKPKSFVGLMALYESNYLRLLRLIPDVDRIDGCFRSRVAGDCDLYVEVIETSRYTVTLSLTYHFATDQGLLVNPDMMVRIYLDGRQAEVLAIGETQRHAALRRLVFEHKLELDRRWRCNMILNKWLEYLSDQGHLILDR